MTIGLRLRAIILAAAVLWAGSAMAQCLTIDPVTVSQPYNPMSPNDYVTSFTVTAHRVDTSLTTLVSAILLRRTGDDRPYQLFVLSDDGGAGGTNIIYSPPGPALQTGIDDPGEIDLNFGLTFGQPSARTFEMQLRIPAGSDLPAGNVQARFDLKYLCERLLFSNQTGTVSQGFQLNFTVSSALQASLVGATPDFGEIGNLTSAQVAVAPLATTERRHYVRVASSGPYEIRVESQNGWSMTATGAPTGNAAERIYYRYEVLGQQLTNTQRTFTPVRCRTSGVSAQNIPLTARLTEGGSGKTPSNNYRDFVTITITPLAAAATSTVNCP